MFLYNLALNTVSLFFRFVWRSTFLQGVVRRHHEKALSFILAQEHALDDARRKMTPDGREVWWFHAASFGEFNVVRPVILRLRAPNRRIVVTFFSPSGYRMLTDENRARGEVDDVFYMPFDTPGNVRQWLDAVRPSKAVFAVSEYWVNYLSELGRRHIPTYFVSMLVGDRSYLRRWYSRPLRRALRAVTTFLVLDDRSKRNLSLMGFRNVEVAGDPLFDNAAQTAREPYHDSVIERFCAGAEVFVAGSVSDEKDLELVAALANANRRVKFIVVPHEISAQGLRRITYVMQGKTLRYSECDDTLDLTNAQVLVIDFLGSLARIYRYGQWAYVGGGFTPYLHSVIEPLAYGLPVAFGPCTGRKNTPAEMVRRGMGCVVRSASDLQRWFQAMCDPAKLDLVRQEARRYFHENTYSTDKAIKILTR